MNNDHLIPPAVLDMIDKLRTVRQSEKAFIISRLEATRLAIEKALKSK